MQLTLLPRHQSLDGPMRATTLWVGLKGHYMTSLPCRNGQWNNCSTCTICRTLIELSNLCGMFFYHSGTPLPYLLQAVRGAWANSMHELEQGNCKKRDATQWALDRLSISQRAMANSSHLNLQPATRKVCKFYNGNSCSHEGNHGQYKHVRSFCARQGKSCAHPETNCHFKARGGDLNGTK